MFDPTAFENMRVVIEGIFYDKDLDGEIRIIDRNDYFNAAKLSRTYQLAIQLSSAISREDQPFCQITLLSKLENLAAELLPNASLQREVGCFVTIEYFFQYHDDQVFLSKVAKELKAVWGRERTIKIIAEHEPLKEQEKVAYRAIIEFDRIITEDQLEDFTELSHYMVNTLEKINTITKM